jgi:hypothetical protein
MLCAMAPAGMPQSGSAQTSDHVIRLARPETRTVDCSGIGLPLGVARRRGFHLSVARLTANVPIG